METDMTRRRRQDHAMSDISHSHPYQHNELIQMKIDAVLSVLSMPTACAYSLSPIGCRGYVNPVERDLERNTCCCRDCGDQHAWSERFVVTMLIKILDLFSCSTGCLYEKLNKIRMDHHSDKPGKYKDRRLRIRKTGERMKVRLSPKISDDYNTSSLKSTYSYNEEEEKARDRMQIPSWQHALQTYESSIIMAKMLTDNALAYRPVVFAMKMYDFMNSMMSSVQKAHLMLSRMRVVHDTYPTFVTCGYDERDSPFRPQIIFDPSDVLMQVVSAYKLEHDNDRFIRKINKSTYGPQLQKTIERMHAKRKHEKRFGMRKVNKNEQRSVMVTRSRRRCELDLYL